MLILERKRKVSKVNEIKNKGSKLHVIFFCSINEALYFLIKTKRTSIINYLAKNTSIINYLYLNVFFWITMTPHIHTIFMATNWIMHGNKTHTRD